MKQNASIIVYGRVLGEKNWQDQIGREISLRNQLKSSENDTLLTSSVPLALNHEGQTRGLCGGHSDRFDKVALQGPS